MKAVVMDRYGTPDVLELRDVATPTPKADEVLVRVLAASVNDWDWGLLRGAPVNRMSQRSLHAEGAYHWR